MDDADYLRSGLPAWAQRFALPRLCVSRSGKRVTLPRDDAIDSVFPRDSRKDVAGGRPRGGGNSACFWLRTTLQDFDHAKRFALRGLRGLCGSVFQPRLNSYYQFGLLKHCKGVFTTI